jgi:hypothetical protein
VLGVTAGGRLTLRGSSTYAGIPAVVAYADSEFGGIESEPVWLAFFKYGSLVGMNVTGQPFDGRQHLIWAPEAFDTEAVTSYASVPHSLHSLSGNEITFDTPAGMGDPCRWATGLTDWVYITPPLAPNVNIWYPAIPVDGATPLGSPATPAVMRTSNEEGILIPVAGYREASAGNIHAAQGRVPHFWSSTGTSEPNARAWRWENGQTSTITGNRLLGRLVRCVRHYESGAV